MLNAPIDDPQLSLNNLWLGSKSAIPPQKVNHNDELIEILNGFHSHQLADLDKANLMDRVDVKFMLPMAFLPALLKQLQTYYSVLEINNNRISEYYNQYFDTRNMDFYQHHHNGKLNRFKVRQRTYLDTDTRFLEVKFKNNRKRTLKTRISCSDNAKSDDNCHHFIHQQMGTTFDNLVVSQQSGYQRIALANEASAERLTLDFNLWYQLADASKKVTPRGFFIAELKQHKRSKLSPFFQLMSKNSIYPAAFSKYCIGCALLYNNTLKTNQFKTVLRQIEKYSLSNHHPIQLSS
ncbi:polyphosphate polymerase domain-containing protein [uncultured Paraglaciecola sp.]|uniref:polyphosphate polymerase domain-containing protein n=1 Tax=uncultured Paraglaciecola sp. TaxID=1765024 RepID=UPI0030D9976F|tara:strand:+ start:63635 stop:64513 length:879 start_codon:yes stop_codon:yes gene_type:complete